MTNSSTGGPPAATIVMPVFNRQELGVRALRSILEQDIPNAEVLVVDDFSQPPFALPTDIAALPFVRLVRHPFNQGESAARNTGVSEARGEWIAFLDSDDYWLPGTFAPRFAAAQREFAEKQNPLIAYAAGFVLDRTHRQEARVPRASGDPLHFASGIWFSQGSTSILHKRAYDIVGPCDTDLRRLQDFDWFLRFALAGGELKVWDGIAAVVELGRKPDLKTLEVSAARILQKFSEGPFKLNRRLQRRLRAYLDVERASICIANRDYFKGGLYLLRSFWLAPRLRVFLERFWRLVPVPQRNRPGVATSSAA